jgi:hypothetical protein
MSVPKHRLMGGCYPRGLSPLAEVDPVIVIKIFLKVFNF